jgi:prepilin-type N-terminal cleavage/methylation domain-containing protein
MNMILKKRIEDRRTCAGVVMRRRKGFTLVEVIVVLVILAILAAIAIPALTGYIDKAEDKKYIAMTRDRLVAARAVFDEAYATGEIESSSAAIAYVKNGRSGTDFTTTGLKYWSTQVPIPDSRERMSVLLGQKYPGAGNLGNWGLNLIGPPGSESTMLNADGLISDIYPEGNGDGKLYIYVTYRVERLDGIGATTPPSVALNHRGKYNANAGYEIYYYKNGTGLIR